MVSEERLYELRIDGNLNPLKFRASDKGRRGASGTVFELADQHGKAVKIYHDHERSKFEPKIRTMLKVKYKRPHTARFDLAWPEALIVNGSGEFSGFKMPFFGTGCVDLEALIQASEAEKKFGIGERPRLIVGANLALAVKALHELKVYCIDLKPENVRVDLSTNAVGVIDCDGMSVVDIGVQNSPRFYADKCTPDFVSPENMDLRPHKFHNEERQDQFALAAIVYMLLNRGLHPYSGTVAIDIPEIETIAGKIKNNLYPYGLGKGRITPHKHSLYPFLPDQTRRLFDRAFSPSSSRPSAADWFNHLTHLIQQAESCVINPKVHIQFRSAGCPVCQRDRRGFSSKPGKSSSAANASSATLRASAPAGRAPTPPSSPVRSYAPPVQGATPSRPGTISSTANVTSRSAPPMRTTAITPGSAFPVTSLVVVVAVLSGLGVLALLFASGESVHVRPQTTAQPRSPVPPPINPKPTVTPTPPPVSRTVFVPLPAQPSLTPSPVFIGREPTNGWPIYSWRGGRWILPPPSTSLPYHYMCAVNGGLMWCSPHPPNASARPCTQNGQQGWCWQQ
jgi:serine/threonine protein kinase